MNYLKKCLSVGVVLLMVIFTLTAVKAAFNPNYDKIIYKRGKTTKGYVQVQPSFNDNGYHKYAATVCVAVDSPEGSSAFSQRVRTAVGTNQSDSRVLSRTVSITTDFIVDSTYATTLAQYYKEPHSSDPHRPYANPFGIVVPGSEIE